MDETWKKKTGGMEDRKGIRGVVAGVVGGSGSVGSLVLGGTVNIGLWNHKKVQKVRSVLKEIKGVKKG